MRLSEIRGDRVFDVLAAVIEPLANIAQDPLFAELTERRECPEGMTPQEFTLERAKRALPQLVNGHRRDFVEVLSALEGEDPDRYAEELTIPKLIGGVYSILTDKELLSFLA